VSIRIRRLRLVGATKNYDVNFTSEGRVRPLSVVAGEISTGKTSVLEFIAYGLGAGDHPQHQEVQRQVRSVLLELELSGEVAVVERAAFSDQGVAFVHHCSLDELARPHAKSRRVIEPAGADDSLSMLLLEHCGLAGISLKEAPTKEDSPLHPLSFRDVLWLCFLENPRLDSRALLFEPTYMKNLKLRQVIEVIFGVHDDQLAKLGDQLRKLDEQRLRREGALDSLRAFLDENEVPDRLELAGRREQHERELTATREALTGLEQRMAAATEFATDLRAAYAGARETASRSANAVRYNETLLRRLLPLRAQYGEDERKLTFFSEAKTLFDPLQVEFCPSCLQRLPEAATITGGHCSLCRQPIPEGETAIDVKAELAAVRARRREIDRYVADVEDGLQQATAEYAEARDTEQRAQADLDSAVAQSLSPYVSERDRLIGERQRLSDAIRQVETQLGWYESLDQRQVEIGRLEEQIVRIRKEIETRREAQINRDELIETLTGRFNSILSDFGFPKLDDPRPPYLDKNFVPHVRDVSYRDIGSAGAMTLISLAWQLALFELAVEEGYPHPGFLMIDSPQKNLTPEGAPREDEFGDPAIGAHVWHHLVEVSARLGDRAQLIVVDNRPRPEADFAIVVRYTGVRGDDPYGLIDNEFG
jgi:hypothetical protein